MESGFYRATEHNFCMQRKPGWLFSGKPLETKPAKEPRKYAVGVRDFVSANGAKLRVTGRGGRRAILTLPSGFTTVFAVRRNLERGVYKYVVTREIEPDTPEKRGKFEPIEGEDLDILRYEFPALRKLGWPI